MRRDPALFEDGPSRAPGSPGAPFLWRSRQFRERQARISRIYGTAERVMRAKSFSSNFLDLTTGIRLQDVDVDVAVGRLEREYMKFLEDKAQARGIRRRFEKTFKPKEGGRGRRRRRSR